MTQRLEQAFAEAAKLPDKDQELFAEFLLEELHDEGKWQKSFSSSLDVLSRLADEAREDLRHGRTQAMEDLLK